MKNNIQKSVLGVAVALAFGAAHAAPATLSNGSIKAVINDGGSFLVSPGTALGRPGLSYNGVEFVNIDNPSSWWTARGDGFNLTSQYNSNPLGTTTYGLGSSAATTLKIGRLSFVQTVALTASNQISYLVSITNNGTSALTHVKYGVGIDPDQGGSGKGKTLNRILGQGAAAAVSASDTLYGSHLKVTLANTSTSSPTAIAAFINTDCCSAVNPASALSAAQGVGFSTLADDSISLAYNIGTVRGGQTVSLGYNYTFEPVPEPETYAMLLAGLGLLGVVARRRKAQTA